MGDVKEMEKQLQVIVNESGLESTKASTMLEKFQGYFAIAAEWEQKARTIIVTDEYQTTEMELAKKGRLILKAKRIEVEKVRKDLKEQSLREGKAIDGIANVLKALIVPVEEYLNKQEKFVEIRDAKITEERRLKAEKLLVEKEETERIKAEKIRIEKEKVEKKEQEKIRKENERLRLEAEKREEAMRIEREKARKQRDIADQKIIREREEAAKKQRALEEKAATERAKAVAEQRALEYKLQKEKYEAECKARAEREKQEKIIAEQKALLANQIECPFCHKKFTLNK